MRGTHLLDAGIRGHGGMHVQQTVIPVMKQPICQRLYGSGTRITLNDLLITTPTLPIAIKSSTASRSPYLRARASRIMDIQHGTASAILCPRLPTAYQCHGLVISVPLSCHNHVISLYNSCGSTSHFSASITHRHIASPESRQRCVSCAWHCTYLAASNRLSISGTAAAGVGRAAATPAPAPAGDAAGWTSDSFSPSLASTCT